MNLREMMDAYSEEGLTRALAASRVCQDIVLKAKKTLEYTQSLYETKLCTYPRTDSQYLSDDMEDTARNVLSVVQSTFPYLQDERSVSVDFKRVMNSKKVSDHHAIIPTVQIENMHNVQLSEGEIKVLSLISTRVCMATAERYQYRSVKAELECAGNIFTATGTTVVEPGWKKYDAALRSEYKIRMEKEDEDLKSLPPLTEGFMFTPSECKVVEGFTQPPKHFTEDLLCKRGLWIILKSRKPRKINIRGG